jgi:hypothetical protein
VKFRDFQAKLHGGDDFDVVIVVDDVGSWHVHEVQEGVNTEPDEDGNPVQRDEVWIVAGEQIEEYDS